MNKMLQNFVSILVNWQGIWQDFVIVWQTTPCTVCYPPMACLPHRCCWSVARWCNTTTTQFFTKMV